MGGDVLETYIRYILSMLVSEGNPLFFRRAVMCRKGDVSTVHGSSEAGNTHPLCPNDFAKVLSVFSIFIGVATALTAESLRATISTCCSFFFFSSVLRPSFTDSSGFTAANGIGASKLRS
jgi:hypothetical protein